MSENKGTIVYIGGFEMPDRNAAAHRVLNNAKAFKELGYFTVFCGIDKTIEATPASPEKVESFDSWPSTYPKSSKEWAKSLVDFSHIREVLDSYKNLKSVVAYNMHAIPLWRLKRYCKKNSIPLIADITEWYDNDFSFNPVKFIKYIDTKLVMQHLHKRVDAIIAISEYFCQYYRKHVKKIIVIPPLVDIEDDKWNAVNSVKEDNLVRFVYSGSPGTTKDKIGLIVEALAKVDCDKEFVFIVLGMEKDDFVSIFPNQVCYLEALQNKIVFRGRVSHEESIKSLCEADISVFVRDKSRKNMAGFPTKFVECVTSGVSIIASDVSDIRGYFPDNPGSVLIEDCTVDELIRALEEVLSKDIGDIKRINSRVKSNCFDYKEWIEQFEDLLDQ